MKLQFDVTIQEFGIIEEILANNLSNNCQVWVFGSRAKNSALFNSDLDLALECNHKIASKVLTQLRTDFEKSKLPYQVDVLNIGTVEPYFQEIINKKKILFPFKAKSKVPQLRFSEFSGAWEENRLGNVACIFDGTHQTPKYTDKGIPFYSVEHITANQFDDTKYISKDVSEHENKRVKIEREDILMTRIGNIGMAKYIDWDVNASFYVSLALIKKNEFFNSKFLSQLIHSLNFQKQLWKRTIHVAFPQKINLGEIGKCETMLPSLKEQQKIATFLTAVDTKIEQLSKKQALLSAYKKRVMQKIFSQTIRFKADDSSEFPEWEENRLGDLCSTAKSGGTPRSTTKEYYDGDIPFLAISDITKQGKYLTSASKKISQIGIDNSASWIVPINTIIYSMYASVGLVSINKIPLATSQAVINLIIKDGYFVEFIYYHLVEIKKTIHRFIETGTQGNLNAQTVKSLILNIPSHEEQTKIANFLSSIDTKIKQVDKQLDKSKEFKKALLQQMFV